MAKTQNTIKSFKFKTTKTLASHLDGYIPTAMTVKSSLMQDMSNLTIVDNPSFMIVENEVVLKFRVIPEQGNLYSYLSTSPTGLIKVKHETDWLVQLTKPHYEFKQAKDYALLTITDEDLVYYVLLQPKQEFLIKSFENSKATSEFLYLFNLGLLGKVQSYAVYTNGVVMSAQTPLNQDTVLITSDQVDLKNSLDLTNSSQGLFIQLDQIDKLEISAMDITSGSQAQRLMQYLYMVSFTVGGNRVNLVVATI